MTIIDCNTCPVRGQRCSSCFVPVVAGAWLHDERDESTSVQTASTTSGRAPAPSMPLTDAEWDAVDVFVGAGLVHTLDVLELVAHPDTSVVPGWLRVG